MLGFDFGECELKIAQWDGKSVKRLASVAMPDNMVKGGIIVSFEAMAELLKSSLKELHISGRDCAVILPESLVFLRRVSLPAMTAEQLAVNLPYEFRDFLTMDKSKYYYDYAVNSMSTNEDGQPVTLDINAAAAPKDCISEYRHMFRRAGLKLRVAIPREEAYSNLLSLHGESADEEFCFVDLGHSATRLDIFTGTAFETTRTIETGLSAADRAIADALDIDIHMAEVYKRSNHDGAQVLPDAVNIYNSIALELRRAVNFYSFNNQSSSLHDLWCCGGGAHIASLTEAVAQHVELGLRDVGELLPEVPADEDVRSYVLAIGAAVQEA